MIGCRRWRFCSVWMATVGSQVLVGVSRLSVQIGSDPAIPHNHLGVEERYTLGGSLGGELDGRAELVHAFQELFQEGFSFGPYCKDVINEQPPDCRS